MYTYIYIYTHIYVPACICFYTCIHMCERACMKFELAASECAESIMCTHVCAVC